MQFKYDLEEGGWATLTVLLEGQTLQTRVSYLNDSFAKLAQAALYVVDEVSPLRIHTIDCEAEPGGLRILVAPRRAEVLPPLEPGEWHWEERLPPDQILVTLRFEERVEGAEAPPGADSDSRPRTTPEPLAEITTTGAEFAGAVLAVLEDVYDRFGVVAYRRRWCKGEFPVAEMVRIRDRLGRPAEPRTLW